MEDTSSTQAVHEFSQELGHWVEALDLKQITRRVEDFGRDKPVALALAALTVGIAAGILMRPRSAPS